MCKSIRGTLLSGAVILGVSICPAMAQQVTGTLGSPEATTTSPGTQLPAPEPKFGGVIKEKASESTPWWPPRIVPPEKAPNVLLIMTDDQGYGAPSTFGGVIPTPNMDRIANAGLRYTNFHSTSLCSPTRAALITGRNHHSNGMGRIIELATGFPGYSTRIPEANGFVPAMLTPHGYAAWAVGKWHLTKDSDAHDAGPRHSWPCQRGFDRFYGFLDGFTNLHHPHRLIEDNHAVEVDRYPDGYYFTDDMTDRAIAMLKAAKASDPERPFFLYRLLLGLLPF